MVSLLEAKGVTYVAMESTGVYWKSIYNLLEETEIQPMVVKARDIKNVPTLVRAARAAARTKRAYLSAFYHRLTVGQGYNSAAFVVGHHYSRDYTT